MFRFQIDWKKIQLPFKIIAFIIRHSIIIHVHIHPISAIMNSLNLRILITLDKYYDQKLGHIVSQLTFKLNKVIPNKSKKS